METRNRKVPHPCVVDINQEGYLGSKESQPHTSPHSLGFQCQKDKFPLTSGCKNQWGLGQRKKLQDSQVSPLEGPTMDLGLTQTHSLSAPALA